MDEQSNTKSCIACCSNIPQKAKKCLNCGSYQDWRRFIDIGNTTIALLIACISVTALLSEKITSLYKEIDGSHDIEVAKGINSINKDKAVILFTSLGDSPISTPKSVHCDVPITAKYTRLGAEKRYPRLSEIASYRNVFYDAENSMIIEPGTSKLIDFNYSATYKLYKAPKDGIKDWPVPSFCVITVKDIYGEHHQDNIFLSVRDTASLYYAFRPSEEEQAQEFTYPQLEKLYRAKHQNQKTRTQDSSSKK